MIFTLCGSRTCCSRHERTRLFEYSKMKASLLYSFLFLYVLTNEVTSIKYTPEIKIKSGPIRGIVSQLNTGGSIKKYLGIPFAKAQRFGKPTEPEPWTDTKDVNTTGKMCPQPSSLGFPISAMSEDCLHLNIFAPGEAGSSLDVMVWIHGGAFILGSNKAYDCSYIASLGNVIVVVINYRLNVFGFLATSKDGDLTGNYGMLDQVFALEWVRDNIDKFGGDPTKVTIFGMSAGGASVNTLILSPKAKGLFKHAIIQSGTTTARWAHTTYSKALQVAKTVGKDAGCDDMKTLADCLKKKSIQEIVDIVKKTLKTGWFFPPVIGGSFLPADSPEALYHKAKIDVKVMIGSSSDEGNVITNAIKGASLDYFNVTNGFERSDFISALREQKTKLLGSENKVINEAILYRYTDWNNVTNRYRNRRMFMDMIGDSLFVAPAIKTAKALVNSSVETYMYHVEYRMDKYFIFHIPSWVGAIHGAELPLLFGFPLMGANSSVNSKDGNFSRDVIRLWTNFAKSGNPNKPADIGLVWPQYDLQQQQFMALKPNMAVQAKLRNEYVAFWNSFVPAALKSMPKPPPPPVDSSGTVMTISGLVMLLCLSGSALL